MLIFAAVLDVLFYGFFYFFQLEACEDIIFPLLTSKTLASTSGMITILMPALSVFCNVMAMRGVYYDIALLASADRLRPSRKK